MEKPSHHPKKKTMAYGPMAAPDGDAVFFLRPLLLYGLQKSSKHDKLRKPLNKCGIPWFFHVSQSEIRISMLESLSRDILAVGNQV